MARSCHGHILAALLVQFANISMPQFHHLWHGVVTVSLAEVSVCRVLSAWHKAGAVAALAVVVFSTRDSLYGFKGQAGFKLVEVKRQLTWAAQWA